jgi:hypothetical protein
MDDWDAISSPAEDTGATDWDTVSSPVEDAGASAASTPLPQRPLKQVRPPVKLSISRRFVLLGLAGLVIVALAGGAFAIYHASRPSTATILQQATSGTPAIDDPLSSENGDGDFGILNTTWGGACASIGGAYHLTLAYPVYWIWCVSREGGNHLNNFALQVQVNIEKGDGGGVVFGYTTNEFYRTYIRSNGTYALLENIQSNKKQTQVLRYNSSSAIPVGFNHVSVVTVVVNSGSFYLFVNGRYVTSDTLNDYEKGAIGLTAESLTQSTDVAFSNLKVWIF